MEGGPLSQNQLQLLRNGTERPHPNWNGKEVGRCLLYPAIELFTTTKIELLNFVSGQKNRVFFDKRFTKWKRKFKFKKNYDRYLGYMMIKSARWNFAE